VQLAQWLAKHDRREIASTTKRVEGWYDDLAASLTGRRALPDPLPRDDAAEMRLLDALRADLRGGDDHATATAVRLLWTGDHLDRVRRLEGAIIEPAREGVVRGYALARVDSGEPNTIVPANSRIGVDSVSARLRPRAGREESTQRSWRR
jgi:hypothetical protein